MHAPNVRARRGIARVFLALLVLTLSAVSCGPHERPLLPSSQTWAELRAVRRGVTVTVGLAFSPRDGATPGLLMRIARRGARRA